jgi:hypothetical protein
MLRVYRDLENSNLINGNENGVNSKKLEKFLEIKIFVQNQQIEKERLEKERIRIQLESDRLEKERLEKERIRIQLESDRLEKERLEKELVRVLTSNTFKFKKFEMASAPFDSLMSWEVANKACSNLGDGWRLPTEKELDKIYNNRYKKNIYSTTLFYYWYWSSSKNSSGRFWATDFGRNYKDVYFGFFDSSMKNKVWAVRNLTN